MLLSSKLSVLIAILAMLHLQQSACLTEEETDHISKRSESDQSHVIEARNDQSDKLEHQAENLKHQAKKLKHDAQKIKEQEKHDNKRKKDEEKHERQWKKEHPEHSYPVVLPVVPSHPKYAQRPKQPAYPPYQPFYPPSHPYYPPPSNWHPKNYCSGTYDELTVDDCKHAFDGLIDYSWYGSNPWINSNQWISSPDRLKTSRHGDCKASVTCRGDYQFTVSAGELYDDVDGQGGAHALLKNCVRHGYSGWSTIHNGCSVSFERSRQTRSQRPQWW